MQRPSRHFLAGGFAALTFLTSLQAQEWALKRLEESPRHLEWVSVKHGDREVKCFIGYPEAKTKATTVIVIHEIFGLTDWVRGVVDQLAEAGYIAIAPDLLSGMAPAGGGTTEFGGGDAVRRAISSLPPDQVTADLDATAKYAGSLSAANGKVVVGGFCWGGAQTFRYASNNPDIKAAFVFYGGPPASEAELGRIQAPVYGFYGENDDRINSTIERTQEQMKKLEKTYEPKIYPGAGHGFMRAGEQPGGSEANQKARTEAWSRWKSILAGI